MRVFFGHRLNASRNQPKNPRWGADYPSTTPTGQSDGWDYRGVLRTAGGQTPGCSIDSLMRTET